MLTKLFPEPKKFTIQTYEKDDLKDNQFYQFGDLSAEQMKYYGVKNGDVVYLTGHFVDDEGKSYDQLYKQDGTKLKKFDVGTAHLTPIRGVKLNPLQQLGREIGGVTGGKVILTEARKPAEKIAAFKATFPAKKIENMFHDTDKQNYYLAVMKSKLNKLTPVEDKQYAKATILLTPPVGTKLLQISNIDGKSHAPHELVTLVMSNPVAVLETVKVGTQEYLKIATRRGIIGYIEKTDPVVAAITEKGASNTNAVA